MKILAFIVLSAAALGCQTYTPVIDPGSVQNSDRYYRDQAECRAIAKQARLAGRTQLKTL